MSKFEVNVEPLGFVGVKPKYDVTIYQLRHAGVCGPVVTEDVIGLDGVDELLERYEFQRVGEYGEVCANGFATAPIERKAA